MTAQCAAAEPGKPAAEAAATCSAAAAGRRKCGGGTISRDYKAPHPAAHCVSRSSNHHAAVQHHHRSPPALLPDGDCPAASKPGATGSVSRINHRHRIAGRDSSCRKGGLPERPRAAVPHKRRYHQPAARGGKGQSSHPQVGWIGWLAWLMKRRGCRSHSLADTCAHLLRLKCHTAVTANSSLAESTAGCHRFDPSPRPVPTATATAAMPSTLPPSASLTAKPRTPPPPPA